MIDVEHYVRVGDDEADRTVRAIGGPHETFAAVARCRSLANRDPLPSHLPGPLTDYFRATEGLPEDTRRDALERAARFADAHLPYLSVSLLCASMPLLFGGQKGAMLLCRTGELIDDVDRRVNETGRFVLNVVAPRAFEPTGRAIRAAQCVRLIHAAVRVRFDDPIDVAINQVEQIATLLAFSTIALRSMERLGVRVGRRDAEDFWHLWRVVGLLLGITPRLLPTTHDEARAAVIDVIDAQLIASDEGQKLTAVLVDGVRRHLPGHVPPHTASALVRHLIGDRAASALGLETTHRPSFARYTSWISSRTPALVAAVSPRLAAEFHRRVVAAKTG